MIFTAYDLAADPIYTLQLSAGYLENSHGDYDIFDDKSEIKYPPEYEIKTSNFLPTFAIEPRSADLLTLKYYDYAKETEIPAIPCTDLI